MILFLKEKDFGRQSLHSISSPACAPKRPGCCSCRRIESWQPGGLSSPCCPSEGCCSLCRHRSPFCFRNVLEARPCPPHRVCSWIVRRGCLGQGGVLRLWGCEARAATRARNVRRSLLTRASPRPRVSRPLLGQPRRLFPGLLEWKVRPAGRVGGGPLRRRPRQEQLGRGGCAGASEKAAAEEVLLPQPAGAPP